MECRVKQTNIPQPLSGHHAPGNMRNDSLATLNVLPDQIKEDGFNSSQRDYPEQNEAEEILFSSITHMIDNNQNQIGHTNSPPPQIGFEYAS